MSPQQLILEMIAAEHRLANEPDARRVIRNERQTLQVALSARQGNIREVAAEALRVLKMWL